MQKYIDIPVEYVVQVGRIVQATATEIVEDDDRGFIMGEVVASGYSKVKPYVPNMAYQDFRSMVTSRIW
jgi:hypothetical protein